MLWNTLNHGLVWEEYSSWTILRSYLDPGKSHRINDGSPLCALHSFSAFLSSMLHWFDWIVKTSENIRTQVRGENYIMKSCSFSALGGSHCVANFKVVSVSIMTRIPTDRGSITGKGGEGIFGFRHHVQIGSGGGGGSCSFPGGKAAGAGSSTFTSI
jgi:hypothetical protein